MAEKIKVGSVSLTIYPDPRPDRNGAEYWKAIYYDHEGKRRYLTRASKADLKSAARAKAREIHNQTFDLASLSEEQARLCRAFLDLDPDWSDIEALKTKKQRRALTVAEAIEEFQAHLLTGKKELSRYQRDLIKLLLRFAATVEGDSLASLDRSDLSHWIDGLEVGEKRKKDARDALTRLWRYCADENVVTTTNGLTAADRITKIKVTAADEVRFLSSDEMTFLLGAVTKDYLPWLVLGSFSGLRSEEIHARNYGDKKPLDWSQVKREQGHIELYASQSKNERRRLIPILPTLAAWLDAINPPKEGRIVPGPPTAWQTKRLGEQLDQKFKRKEGWPKNCLRHSYATYRIAETQDLPRVSMEMDNSVSMLKRHYDGITTEDRAKAYWLACHPIANPREEGEP